MLINYLNFVISLIAGVIAFFPGQQIAKRISIFTSKLEIHHFNKKTESVHIKIKLERSVLLFNPLKLTEE